MAEHDDLLKRVAPMLRYDSNEQYFVDSAAQWTDCPGNELRRKDMATGKPGEIIASASPLAGEPQLTLTFLGPDGDYQLAFGAGTHEGDWKMVQLRMHPSTRARSGPTSPSTRSTATARSAPGRM